MSWLDKIKDKITGAKTEEKAPDAAGAPGGMPDLKELEKKGMLGQFFRHWKNPAFLKQVQVVAARMKAEGVDIKDQKAVTAWMQAHQKELASGTLGTSEGGEAPAKPQTFVKTGPEVGRNDPCHCGSGKKFKKCHGANA